MDPAYSTKPDSYYFNKMQPLEWNDNYVFTATNTPQQIQVWDGEKGKLVHTYSLSTDVTKWGQGTERALDILDMTVINKSVWIICSGKQRNLIKLDVETGEMKYIELDCSVLYLKGLVSGNKGNGCVVVATRTAPKVGIAIRILDLEGNVLNKYNVKHEDIDVVDIKGMRYINDEYILTMSKFNEFNYIENEQKGFSLLKLKENEEYFIEEISFDKVLSNSFVTNNVIQQSAEFITVFEMEDYVNDYDTIYVELSLIDMYNCQRFLFEYDYQLNEFVYKDICYNKKDSRTMYSVAKNKDFIFITGNSSYEGYNGLETGLYLSTGGEQQKRVRLPNANQLYCTMKEDCAWFSKDLYTQDAVTLKWDKSNTPQIYKLDYKEQQVYQYNADGSYTILDWIQD
jgi:WD40 repeat protein